MGNRRLGSQETGNRKMGNRRMTRGQRAAGIAARVAVALVFAAVSYTHLEHRLEGVDRAHVGRLCLGKCVRFRRRVTRAESVRKETFADLFAYLDDHGYALRGDVILFLSLIHI